RLADTRRLYASGWPSGVDPRKTVLLKSRPQGVLAGVVRRPGTARLVRYANTEVEGAGGAPDRGRLLRYDVSAPWARATVDGHPIHPRPANPTSRAVALPPGSHPVRFTFEPFAGAIADLAHLAGLSN